MANKTLILALLLLLLSKLLPAQIIINSYAAVNGYAPCNNALIVDTASGFNAGDTVLMIQMKGAVADSSNTPGFGNIIDYRAAGNYEYNVISYKNADSIALKYKIVRNYNINGGKVQLVRVASYSDYSVNQLHTCMPWDGNKGGVFVLRVNHTLFLNSVIDVSGKGFRGGQVLASTASNCNRTDYYYPPGNNYGAAKGEGITELLVDKSYGRGALANGGGGGNDHNSGGGGGSNAGSGGLGGNQYNLSNCSPIIPAIGGIGGYALNYSGTQQRIFAGGGGGAGQGNNLGEKPGAAGGGIIIIEAANIITNSGMIIANGDSALQCSAPAPGCRDDGTGGGGGGGAILLKAGTYIGNIMVTAKGGKGANTWVSQSTTQVAPGGGGSGGIIWYTGTLPAVAINNVSGGANGVLPQFGNSAWGAQPGQSGQIRNDLIVVQPADTFTGPVIADFSDSAAACFTRYFKDQSIPALNVTNHFWQFPDNSNSTLANPSFNFQVYGNYSVSLRVSDNNGCIDSISKDIIIPYVHFADAGNDALICLGTATVLQASGGATYSWSPVSGLDNPSIASPAAAPRDSMTYVVTVTSNEGCKDKDSIAVRIMQNPVVSITALNGVAVDCRNRTLQLVADGALSYNWSPGALCNDSTIAGPLVTPPATTLFTVTGKDGNGCTDTDTISVFSLKGKTRILMPNAFSPDHNGLNDDIKPMGLCNFELEHFTIYNRDGQKIFSTSQPDKGWDGTYKGGSADIGTYFYLIRGKNDSGESFVQKGNFILIR
jgi:gliding motility-associated-like protein